MTKADAKKIAKIHMYSFFYHSDGFYADNLSFEDNQKVTKEMKELCVRELNKIGVDSQITSEDCVDVILNK